MRQDLPGGEQSKGELHGGSLAGLGELHYASVRFGSHRSTESRNQCRISAPKWMRPK